MSFSLTINEHSWVDPLALDAAVKADALAGGGTIVPGQPPSVWLLSQVQGEALDPLVAARMAANQLRSREPAVVCEAARLCGSLEHPAIGKALFTAFELHDVGLLLSRDPFHPDRSVEDALLRAWASQNNHRDKLVRRRLLEALRHAGLVDLELEVLLRHCSESELSQWLPAIIEERVPEEAGEALAYALDREEGVHNAVIASLSDLPLDERRALVTSLEVVGLSREAQLLESALIG